MRVDDSVCVSVGECLTRFEGVRVFVLPFDLFADNFELVMHSWHSSDCS